MKIDLHFHSIKTRSDTSDRQIKDIKEAVEILNRCEIGILAFTNHNYFDIEQFNEFKQYDKNIIFLPGMELDVWYNNRRIQMNVIVDEPQINLLINLNDLNLSPGNPICFNKLIQEFKEHKAIFYVDKKNNTSIKDNEILQIKNKIEENKYHKVVLDVNNYNKFKYFLRWDIASLIGSDCNINEYIEKSRNLLEYTNIVINGFDDLFDIFSDNLSYDFFVKNKLLIDLNDIQIEEKNNENNKEVKGRLRNLKIVQKGVNVIFGPKASGKSLLLRNVYDYIKNKKKNYYEPSDTYKKDEHELITKEQMIPSTNQFFDKKNNEINENIRRLKKLDLKIKTKSPADFFNGFNNNKNLLRWKVRILDDISNINNQIEKIINNFDDILHEYKLISSNNSQMLIENYETSINELKKLIINKYKQINKMRWKKSISNKMIEKFNEIFLIHKGINPTISSFGLLEKFKVRLSIINQINEINLLVNKMLDEKQKIKSFNVPIEDGNKKIYIMCQYEYSTQNCDYLKSFKAILKLKIKDKLIDKIEDFKKCEKKELFKYKYYFIDEFNNKLSTGEKSFLTLQSKFSKDYDYLFIDEPETYLNNKFICDKILELIYNFVYVKGKTLIITTHNCILGINSNPNNYILRESNIVNGNGEDKTYNTYFGNLSNNKLTNAITAQENSTFTLRDKILEYFEGNKKMYEYRRRVYNV